MRGTLRGEAAAGTQACRRCCEHEMERPCHFHNVGKAKSMAQPPSATGSIQLTRSNDDTFGRDKTASERVRAAACRGFLRRDLEYNALVVLTPEVRCAKYVSLLIDRHAAIRLAAFVAVGEVVEIGKFPVAIRRS
jgi:hypothetical protein